MIMLKFEGVTFIVDAVRRMTKEEFIGKHLNVYWKDRKEKQRRKMLTDVYEKIAGKSSDEVTE